MRIQVKEHKGQTYRCKNVAAIEIYDVVGICCCRARSILLYNSCRHFQNIQQAVAAQPALQCV